MPSLKNPKYEAIAQAIAHGATQLKAAQAAGMRCRTRSTAARTCNRPEIKARIKELMASDAEVEGLRDRLRTAGVKGKGEAAAVTKEYVFYELQLQLAQARANGLTKLGFDIIKTMAVMSGLAKAPHPHRNTKLRVEQATLAESGQLLDEEEKDAKAAADLAAAPSIDELSKMTAELDGLSAADDDDEA